jgi:hypothetical protein
VRLIKPRQRGGEERAHSPLDIHDDCGAWEVFKFNAFNCVEWDRCRGRLMIEHCPLFLFIVWRQLQSVSESAGW